MAGRRGHRRVGGAAALAALAVMVPTAGAEVPSGNLIQNPGAETGAAFAAPPSWTVTGQFSARPYGAEGATFSTSIGGGANFLSGGPDNPVSTARQVFDVSGAASEVDAGRVDAALRGYLGGYLNDQDTMRVDVETQGSGAGAPFAPLLRIGPVTAGQRNNQTVLLLRSAAGRVPTGTRRIRVTATSVRSPATYDPAGSGALVYNDGWGDNLSLTLSATQASPSTGPTVRRRGRVAGIRARGRRVKGRISVRAPCKSGRRVVIKKGRKTIGSARSKAGGRFNIKTKKHKKGKLTVKVRKRTVGNTTCAAIKKRVPGRH